MGGIAELLDSNIKLQVKPVIPLAVTVPATVGGQLPPSNANQAQNGYVPANNPGAPVTGHKLSPMAMVAVGAFAVGSIVILRWCFRRVKRLYRRF